MYATITMQELIILGDYSKDDPIKGLQVYSIFKALAVCAFHLISQLP
jgi:hypothetical protein